MVRLRRESSFGTSRLPGLGLRACAFTPSHVMVFERWFLTCSIEFGPGHISLSDGFGAVQHFLPALNLHIDPCSVFVVITARTRMRKQS